MKIYRRYIWWQARASRIMRRLDGRPERQREWMRRWLDYDYFVGQAAARDFDLHNNRLLTPPKR